MPVTVTVLSKFLSILEVELVTTKKQNQLSGNNTLLQAYLFSNLIHVHLELSLSNRMSNVS